LFRKGSLDLQTGFAHGDCAPWNLLETPTGWVLVDWEEARTDAPPFFDLFHYLVQAHARLGRPRLSAIKDGLHGRGWIHGVIVAYSEGANVDPHLARSMLREYLRSNQGRWLESGPKTSAVRKRLLRVTEL
jgi:thiamine kinase-like enzyme